MSDALNIAELQVKDAKRSIELGFAKLGYLLSEIDEQQMYRGFGFPKFKLWIESSDVEISHRVALDLIRIHREVKPLLGEGGDSEIRIGRIGVSKVRAMLPLLNMENGKTAFKKLFDELEQSAIPMTWNDVRQEVKKLRGIEKPIDARYATVFKATVTRGEKVSRVEIVGMDGVAIETLGVLSIPNAWMPRWVSRFGDFVEHIKRKGMHTNGLPTDEQIKVRG